MVLNTLLDTLTGSDSLLFSFLHFFIQTDEVLGKDSAEELNKGNNPGPMTEIKFWDAKVGKLAKEGEFDFCCSFF